MNHYWKKIADSEGGKGGRMCCVEQNHNVCLFVARPIPPPFPLPPSAVAVAGERGDEKYQEYFNLFGSEEDVETASTNLPA